jgi:hypothetical protein
MDFFANVVGMFEMNNISMEIPHPLSRLNAALMEESDYETKEVSQFFETVQDHVHYICTFVWCTVILGFGAHEIK